MKYTLNFSDTDDINVELKRQLPKIRQESEHALDTVLGTVLSEHVQDMVAQEISKHVLSLNDINIRMRNQFDKIKGVLRAEMKQDFMTYADEAVRLATKAKDPDARTFVFTKGKPSKSSRSGGFWNGDEDTQLVSELNSFVLKTAKEHNRTHGAITSRIHKLRKEGKTCLYQGD